MAIEVSDSMLTPPPPSSSKKADRDTPLAAALKCAYHLMQQRIISNPRDMMGVLLFGTEKSKYQDETGDRSAPVYPHCYLFTDLDIPAAEDVKALQSLAHEDDKDNILVPSKEPASMANVLFCANQVFTTKAANFGSRRLFIITDDDNPHSADKQAKSAAAVRAKDLYDLGVVIELFPLRRTDSQFDVSKFYDVGNPPIRPYLKQVRTDSVLTVSQDIVYRDPAGEANMTEVLTSKSEGGLSLLNSLIANINSKQTAKRALFSGVPFEIAPGMAISVKGYNVIHRQKEERSCYIWLDGEIPQIATGETTKVSEDSARTIEKGETKKAYKFGGEYVYFTPEEQKLLKDFGPTGIRIIGFKPRSSLPIWASIKRASFIFPSEEHYVGSMRVFTALWKKLIKDDKIGVAWAITRANAKPALFAIIPSRNRGEEDSGTPFLPAGLWMYPLPFADDIRNPPDLPEPAQASDDLAEKVKIITENLWFPIRMYDPSRYPNPQLQWHYKILQALALQEEVPDQAEDMTIPKYKSIAKRVGGHIRDWETLVDEEVAHMNKASAGKRGAEGDEDEKPKKRVKSEKASVPEPQMSGPQLKAASETGGLAKMTVAQLKDVLAIRGLPVQGKKVELVERLEAWVDENA